MESFYWIFNVVVNALKIYIMDLKFTILWFGIIFIFILRILVWFKIKRILSVNKDSKEYEYFADLNTNAIVSWIPKRLDLMGEAKMWARHYNNMTILFYGLMVINFIFLMIDDINNNL